MTSERDIARARAWDALLETILEITDLALAEKLAIRLLRWHSLAILEKEYEE